MSFKRTETPYRLGIGPIAHRLRFTAGMRTFRSRGTADWLMMLTVAGTGRVDFRRASQRVVVGDVQLYAPGATHDFGATDHGDWDVLWSHFLPRLDWAEWMRWPEFDHGVHHTHIPASTLAEVIHVMEKVVVRSQAPSPRRELLAMNGLEELILLCDTSVALSGSTQLDVRVREAMRYMCAEIEHPLRIAGIARACGLSVSRLAHLFTEQVGISIQEWLEGQRLERACQRLLLTTEPIAAIAESLGFSSPFYFSRRFAKRLRMSPRAYRQRGSR